MEPCVPEEASYEATLATLFASTRSANVKWTWDDVKRIMDIFGNPQLDYRVVHVAGTNGKGSVSLKVAAALQRQGYKTGLFISPHISDFRERIQVNSQRVSEDYVRETGQMIMRELRTRGIQFHFFEVTTLLGFLYFRQERVDFAVIEVGIGGLLDTTNVVCPEVAVITSIGYDHMNILGTTLDQIAFQKAGIIKPGAPCVIGPNCPASVFREKCETTGSELIQVADVPGSTYEEENNRIAVAALRVLQQRGVVLSEESFTAVVTSHQPFRFQRERLLLQTGRTLEVILDVGHNCSAVSRFLEDVGKAFPDGRLHAFVGMSANKDIRSTLQLIIDRAEKVHCFSVSHPRLLRHNELHAVIQELNRDKAGLSGEVDVIDSVLSAAQDCDLLLICGSCFIMAPIFAALAHYERV